MKKLFIISTVLLFATGCAKKIEKIQQDMIISAMTEGQWKVTNFKVNSTDITTDFSLYTFKYYDTKTVDAIKSGTVEITGTWDGNAPAMITWAKFVSPPYPIGLLNGTWYITKSSWTYVEATQISGSDTKFMRLDKV